MTRRNWLAGFVVGAWAGFLLLYGVVPGIALIVLFGVVAVARRSPASIGGLLTGVGASVLLILTLANLNCRGVIGSGDGSCAPPDLTGWFVAGVAAFAGGLALTIRARRGGR